MPFRYAVSWGLPETSCTSSRKVSPATSDVPQTGESPLKLPFTTW
jgi:hypothetical protein